MICTFIVIFCGTVYLLGWLAIIILQAVFQALTSIFKRLFKIEDKHEPEPVPESVDDDIVEIKTVQDGAWGRL